MATWIVALVVICIVYLAAKHVYRTHKQGGCVGCSAGNNGCCHCTNIKAPKLKQQDKCCGQKR